MMFFFSLFRRRQVEVVEEVVSEPASYGLDINLIEHAMGLAAEHHRSVATLNAILSMLLASPGVEGGLDADSAELLVRIAARASLLGGYVEYHRAGYAVVLPIARTQHSIKLVVTPTNLHRQAAKLQQMVAETMRSEPVYEDDAA